VTVRVEQFGEWWAVVSGDGPVRTPMGTPVVSRHRALAEEVAADVARHGTDPTARTTTFSLQASYLDFGLRVKREVLEENTAAIWPDDLFVQRPADPAPALALAALWGTIELDRAGFRNALRRASLRQVMAAMTAGAVLRSAVVGYLVVTTDRELTPLARGACGRFFDALRRRTTAGEGALRPGAGPARHVPSGMDDAYCEESCSAGAAAPGDPFRARCALYPLVDKLRRWAAFPEEAVKG